MSENTKIQHVALNYQDKEKADLFFVKVLGLKLKKTFALTPELAKQIFGIKERVLALSYENKNTRFEVFITEQLTENRFEHTCIIVNNKEDFIQRCKKHGLQINLVKKDGKTYLFVRDFSNNLYEVKEKQ